MPESFMTVQLPLPARLTSSDRYERTPQAGPLPVKKGEIGFVQGVHALTNKHEDESAETSSSLPPRHPADRDYQSPTRRSSSQSTQAVNETRTLHESPDSCAVTKGLFGCLKPKRVLSVGGLQLPTLLLFAIQLISLGGTIAIWVFATRSTKATSAPRQRENSLASLMVCIHGVFVIVIVGQVVFLERRIYRLRGERHEHLRPGEVLPRHGHSLSSPDSIVSVAPWNRPPLPTYGAVLTQSGVATGDVEDNLIAIPPPPAYGNIRGSTLLYPTGSEADIGRQP